MISSKSSALRWSRTTLFLLLVCILAAIPMVYFGVTYYIEYDGYWHVFIAKQTWSNLLTEYQATAHPPLFFFLLRGAIAIGNSRLIYRLVSILSGLGAIFVIGQIARDVTGSTLAAVLTAFVFGLSESAILISLEVRSYMLCAFFVLLAFKSYLKIVSVEPSQSSDRAARIGFCASLCLAILSHYSAFFFLMACLTAPLCLALVNSEYRARLFAFLRARWLANFLTVFPIFGIGLALYWFQGRAFATPLAYLSRFYFDPAGSESRIQFLLRNLQNTFDLFSPVRFEPALIPLCVFAAIAVYFARSRAVARDILENLTTAVFLLMLGAFMLASLRGRYPFGGGLRHQFLLFPFLALSAVALLDRLAALIRVRHARAAVLALAFLAAAVNAKAAYTRFQNIRNDHATRDVAVFRNVFPHPRVVLLDQFSVVNFFTQYYDWKWRTVAKNGPLYQYAVSKNGQEFTVMRYNSIWNFDFTEALVYSNIRQAMATAPSDSITVFCMDQFGSHVPRAPAEEPAFLQNVQTLASRSDLHLERLVVNGIDVFAQFGYAGIAK
jgi:hypothetical protein